MLNVDLECILLFIAASNLQFETWEGKVGEDSREGLSGIIPNCGKFLSMNLEVRRLSLPAFLSSLFSQQRVQYCRQM